MKWRIPSLASVALVLVCLGAAKADLDSPENAIDAPEFEDENNNLDHGHHRLRHRLRIPHKHNRFHKPKHTCKCIEDTQTRTGC